jgi:hypothetical protein
MTESVVSQNQKLEDDDVITVEHRSDDQLWNTVEQLLNTGMALLVFVLVAAFAYFVPLGPQLLVLGFFLLLIGTTASEAFRNGYNFTEVGKLIAFAGITVFVLWTGGFWKPFGL